jgi:hypothetical protein
LIETAKPAGTYDEMRYPRKMPNNYIVVAVTVTDAFGGCAKGDEHTGK